jgi:anion-transporting  ArsA/GET3 family ATPase
MPSPLLHRRLLVVTGKGGVGKSTVAAALALQLARSGRRTLLCEVNAGDRLAPLLGHAPVGPTITLVEPNLRLVDLHPAESMREYVLLKIRLERVYRAVFENRMVRYFLRFIPSLAETVMLGKVLWHVRQPPGSPDGFQSVVVDAPATGHALTFLGVPRALLTTCPRARWPPRPGGCKELWWIPP